MGRDLSQSPRVPNPKLIPERDGSGGVSWDAHLCFEVSDACRLLRFALEVLILYLGRSGRVYVHRHACSMGAELLQLERVVSGIFCCGLLVVAWQHAWVCSYSSFKQHRCPA